jgi:hypothetical protein
VEYPYSYISDAICKNCCLLSYYKSSLSAAVSIAEVLKLPHTMDSMVTSPAIITVVKLWVVGGSSIFNYDFSVTRLYTSIIG